MNTADMKLTTFFHTFKIKFTEGPEKNHQDWNALTINSSSSVFPLIFMRNIVPQQKNAKTDTIFSLSMYFFFGTIVSKHMQANNQKISSKKN